MRRFLNIIIVLSALSLMTLLVFIFVESLNILKLFPFIVLSFMFLVASFALKLFVVHNELPKFVQFGIGILSTLPLSVPLFGMLEPLYVESNWPLMIAGLVFYAGLGLLSIQGVFTKQNKPPFLSRIFLLIFGLLLTFWFVFVLLKISDSYLYEYTFLFGIVASVIYIIALSIKLARKG